MTLYGIPDEGAQAKRKSDGLIGWIHSIYHAKGILVIRHRRGLWLKSLILTTDQFAHDWELTGDRISSLKEYVKSIVVLCALAAICSFVLINVLRACDSEPANSVSSAAPQKDTSALLEDPQALHDKYGAIAASGCSRSADEYVKSVARYEYKWEDVGMFDEKFNQYSTVYVAPGVTTSKSNKLLLQNGFGAFEREELFCNYDTQEKKVLRYWIYPAD
jgi:hypothetical protein